MRFALPERIPLKEFEWPEAGIAVRLPGSPKELQQNIEKFGVVLPFCVRSAFDGVVSYAVGFTDYPEEIPLPDTVEQFFESFRLLDEP